MELEKIQRQADDALASSTSYEESVSILLDLGMTERTAVSLAAAHHGMEHRDLVDETRKTTA